MKTTFQKFLLSAATMLLLTSTTAVAQKALVLPEEYAVISLESSPSGAKVYHNGKLICNSTPAMVQIPYRGIIMPGKKKDINMRMRRSAEGNKMYLTFVKDGYYQGEEVVTPIIREQGKSYLFEWPVNVIHEFKEKEQQPQVIVKQQDTTVPQQQAVERVNRDNPGATELERTIIRWNFESEPQGARVFWRVISSVPDEVKNTNELWLGSTPYEETRSFNIQGLTYENSRDVEIEVKVRRKGYAEQTKRFNVRQTIDQQEISSFFDLVKE